MRDGVALFYRDGFHLPGVDAVAAAAAISKRTLYNQFSSKDELIGAVLEAQAELADAEIKQWCDDSLGTPEELVRSIFAGLRRWAASPDWRGSGFTRAAMEFAWAPGHPARLAAAAQKRAVEEALAIALDGTGSEGSRRLACKLVILIEGANALRLIHNDDAWFDVAESAAIALVEHRPEIY